MVLSICWVWAGYNVFSGVERANNWTGVFVNDIESQIFTLDTQLQRTAR